MCRCQRSNHKPIYYICTCNLFLPMKYPIHYATQKKNSYGFINIMDVKQYFIFQLKLKAWVKKLLCSLVASVSLTRRQQAEQIIAWGRTSSNTATQYSRGSVVRGSRRCVRLLGITCQTQSNGKHKKKPSKLLLEASSSSSSSSYY